MVDLGDRQAINIVARPAKSPITRANTPASLSTKTASVCVSCTSLKFGRKL
jgi:hypothetical protein